MNFSSTWLQLQSCCFIFLFVCACVTVWAVMRWIPLQKASSPSTRTRPGIKPSAQMCRECVSERLGRREQCEPAEINFSNSSIMLPVSDMLHLSQLLHALPPLCWLSRPRTKRSWALTWDTDTPEDRWWHT